MIGITSIGRGRSKSILCESSFMNVEDDADPFPNRTIVASNRNRPRRQVFWFSFSRYHSPFLAIFFQRQNGMFPGRGETFAIFGMHDFCPAPSQCFRFRLATQFKPPAGNKYEPALRIGPPHDFRDSRDECAITLLAVPERQLQCSASLKNFLRVNIRFPRFGFPRFQCRALLRESERYEDWRVYGIRCEPKGFQGRRKLHLIGVVRRRFGSVHTVKRHYIVRSLASTLGSHAAYFPVVTPSVRLSKRFK